MNGNESVIVNPGQGVFNGECPCCSTGNHRMRDRKVMQPAEVVPGADVFFGKGKDDRLVFVALMEGTDGMHEYRLAAQQHELFRDPCIHPDPGTAGNDNDRILHQEKGIN